jgi:hypothetical protein
MSYNFTVSFFHGSSNEFIIEIPEYLKEPPTTIYQIKEYVRTTFQIDFDNIHFSIIRNTRIYKNLSDDIEIQDNDILCISLLNSEKFVPFQMKTGITTAESKQILSSKILSSIKSPIHSHSNYTGELKDGKKNGFGKIIFSNGNTYEGEWKDNKFNGNGTYIDNYSIYEGNWENGKKNGYGKETTLIFNNKCKGTYEGGFKITNIMAMEN